MDLNEIKIADKSEEGEILTILHPVTFAETDIKIRLAGSDSARYRNKVKKLAEKERGKRSKTINLDAAERQGAEILAACTLDWKGIQRGGVTVPFSYENAVELYSDPNLRWLREQVDEFIADRTNFF